MITIGILEDRLRAQQHLNELLLKWIEGRNHNCKVFTYNTVAALKESEESLDIILLDVIIGDSDVFGTVPFFRKKYPFALFIYIASHEKYRVPVQELHAYSFIRKPVSKDKLFLALDDAFLYLKQLRDLNAQNHLLRLRIPGKFMDILQEDILYFSFTNRRVEAVTVGRCYTVMYTLLELADMLHTDFSFCHRASLVNLVHVVQIYKKEVTLSNGVVLNLSIKRGKKFRADLNAFLKKKNVLIHRGM